MVAPALLRFTSTHAMANVDDASFATYLATFHSTYSDTVEAYVPAGMRGFLDRFSRLSCEVVGYVSTSFGVAFEYVPGSEGIRVGHSSARVEDFFCHAPARVRKLPAMFIIEGGNSGFEGLTLEGAFPFRFGKDANGPVTLADVRFRALGWTRDVYYAEVFPVRVQEEWTRTKAVERAKDEVLRALADIQAMDTANVSLAQFLAGQKQTSVLVAGDFSPAGRKRLDAIRRALRDLGYLPRLLADVPEVFEYDLPEKFAAVATMARFVVIDDSSAAGHIRELADAAERGLLTIVLRQEGSTPSFMTRADALKSTVLREFTYSGEAVRGPLYEATQWAEEQLATLSNRDKRSIRGAGMPPTRGADPTRSGGISEPRPARAWSRAARWPGCGSAARAPGHGASSHQLERAFLTNTVGSDL